MGAKQTGKQNGICDACESQTELKFKVVNPLTRTEHYFCSRGCARTETHSPSDITRLETPPYQ